DPRGRSRNAARRQQPRHQGVLSGIVDVRHDLLRRLRASSAPYIGDRRVRAGVGAERALFHTYRERHGEAIYRFKDSMLPSDFFHHNVVLSFQEDAIGIRLRDVIGVNNMMWGSDYPQHSESTFPQS